LTAACSADRAASGPIAPVARATTDAFSRAGEGIDNALATLETPEDSVVADPFEPFNRAMYNINDGLDRVILGPTSEFYVWAVPEFGRHRVRDFVDNLKNPVWFANDVLQGDLEHAGVTASRFALNSTVGVLGFYDFAAHHADLPKRDEDFGQTLAVWGVGNGAYLMLPIFGPTTFRDLTGTVVDVGMNPLTWAEFEGDSTVRTTLLVTDIVDIRSQTGPAIETVRAAVDPYAQARALYIQNRAERVRNGVSTYEDLPDFE
jgi:phospholipid-binding lipoprotein MlaA